MLHYESCEKTLDAKRPVRLDEKDTEAVVRRILQDNGENIVAKPNNSAPAAQVNIPP